MKTRVSSLAMLAAALGAFVFTPACVAPQSRQAFSHPVGSVERFGNTLAVRGTAMWRVEHALGTPNHKLSENVWAYRHFNAGSAQPGDDDCSTLLVTFTDGRVSHIELINDRAEINYATRLQPKPDDRFQVAAK